jgi:hypothetical protein
MKKIKLSTVCGIMVLLFAAFASQRYALAEVEGVSLEYAPKYSVVYSPATSVTISQASAHRKGEGFVVTGKVKRTHEINLPGHVDLAICAPDGTSLARETLRISGLHSNRKGVLEMPFTFRLDFVPPAGAKVRLEYHAPPFKDEDHLRCV